MLDAGARLRSLHQLLGALSLEKEPAYVPRGNGSLDTQLVDLLYKIVALFSSDAADALDQNIDLGIGLDLELHEEGKVVELRMSHPLSTGGDELVGRFSVEFVEPHVPTPLGSVSRPTTLPEGHQLRFVNGVDYDSEWIEYFLYDPVTRVGDVPSR